MRPIFVGFVELFFNITRFVVIFRTRLAQLALVGDDERQAIPVGLCSFPSNIVCTFDCNTEFMFWSTTKESPTNIRPRWHIPHQTLTSLQAP